MTHNSNHIYHAAAMDGITEGLARCFNTRLGEEEEIPVADDHITPQQSRGPHSLVRRVVSQKVMSGISLKMNLTHLLQSVRGFSFHYLGENRFSICFNHHLDREHALEGSPWVLDRCALLLLPLEDNMDLKTVEINMMKLWFGYTTSLIISGRAE